MSDELVKCGETHHSSLITHYLLERTGANKIPRQIPLALALDQGKGFHAITMLERSLINDYQRMPGNWRCSGLFFARTLKIASAHITEFGAQLLKSRFRFV